MRLLGIESSCDETAVAVVEDGRTILSNVVASQVDIHARYGGIVPEVASRQHLITAIPVVEQALTEWGCSWQELDGVAATMGPGLAGSLLIGFNLAKAIALARGLPLVGVNHLEAHIYANWLETSDVPTFPLICLIVSGGHTDLVLMKGHGQYTLLGKTRDDAAGEAFDKAARVLGLGYPGGPAIEKASQQGDAAHRPLPRAWIKGSHDFSFSGLKTAVLHLAQSCGQDDVADLAAGFQEAVVDVLVTKTIAAALKHRVKLILLAGGVAANSRLRQVMTEKSPLPVHIPPPKLCTDNAAMVAACGYYRLQAGQRDNWNLEVVPGLKLS
jgi:N6-L-threonylcarbamoyladenine synthase